MLDSSQPSVCQNLSELNYKLLKDNNFIKVDIQKFVLNLHLQDNELLIISKVIITIVTITVITAAIAITTTTITVAIIITTITIIVDFSVLGQWLIFQLN